MSNHDTKQTLYPHLIDYTPALLRYGAFVFNPLISVRTGKRINGTIQIAVF
jgi:hypothetical protein